MKPYLSGFVHISLLYCLVSVCQSKFELELKLQPVVPAIQDREGVASNPDEEEAIKQLCKRLETEAEEVGRLAQDVQNGIEKLNIRKHKLSKKAEKIDAKIGEVIDKMKDVQAALNVTLETKTWALKVYSRLGRIERQQSKLEDAADRAISRQHDENIECKSDNDKCVDLIEKKEEAGKRRLEAAEGSKWQIQVLSYIDDNLRGLQLQIDAANRDYDKLRKEVLKNKDLVATVLNLLTNLSSLKTHVDQLNNELKCREILPDEDFGFEWEAVSEPLDKISDYINNGKFVADVAKWGIIIKGLDIASIKELGIEIDNATSSSLGLDD